MAILLVCPGCSTRLTTDDDHAGKTIECYRCSTEISVPLSTAHDSTPADAPALATKFCHECGKSIRKKAAICPECGVPQPKIRSSRDKEDLDGELENANGKKLAAGLCGIFIGGFGIHKFVLGMNRPGLIMLFVTLCSCGFGYPVIHIIGVIEGILYLTKTDEEFNRIYLVRKKEWF